MKQKLQKYKKHGLTALKSAAVLVMAAVLLVAPAAKPRPVVAASVTELQQQAQQLQAQIDANQKKASEYHATADTLQGKVNELQTEIAAANQQIRLLDLQINELRLKIDEANQQLAQQRDVLGADIRAMYLEGDVSTLEMLASSQDLSEFVDKEQYRSTVQDKITTTLDKIKLLKAELQSKQDEVQKLLDEQQAQRNALDDKRREQQSLLDATRGEEARYQQYIRDLTDQQRAVNRQLAALTRSVGSGTGGYPWTNAVCVSTGQLHGDCWNYEWYVSSDHSGSNRQDPWGYYYRNCTSYVAWRSASMGLDVSGLGNANTWDNRAGTLGLSVGTTPKIGAFANWEGTFGHVAYVEDVSGGQVLVSEYNYVADGEYSERWIPLSNAYVAPDHYIYTPWSH